MTSFRLVFLILIIIMLMIGSYVAFEQSISAFIQDAINYITPIEQPKFWIALLVIGVLAVDILLPVPSSLIAVIAGTTLGFVAGSMVIFIGLTIGSVLGYCLGRGLFSVFPSSKLPKYPQQVSKSIIPTIDGWALVLARGIPVLAETSVIVAGSVKYPIAKFFLYTTLANAGIAVLYGYVGDGMVDKHSILSFIFASIVLPICALALKFVVEFIFGQKHQTLLFHHRK